MMHECSPQVANAPPTVACPVAPTQVTEGEEFTLAVTVTDAGSDGIDSAVIEWGDGGASGLVCDEEGVCTASHTYAGELHSSVLVPAVLVHFHTAPCLSE